MRAFYVAIWDARNSWLESKETGKFFESCAWSWAEKPDWYLGRVNEIIGEALGQPIPKGNEENLHIVKR